MGGKEARRAATPASEAEAARPATSDREPPATLGQKILIGGLWLYVLSLFWLVLSHHWYGVLPRWLDPH